MRLAGPRHIILYEPAFGGHRPHYVRWIASACLRSCSALQITLVTAKKSSDDPVIRTLGDEFGDRFYIYDMAELDDLVQRLESPNRGMPGKIGAEFSHINILKRAIPVLGKNINIDLVFIPYLDYCGRALGMVREPFGGIPWGGIVLRTHFHMRSMGMDIPNRWYYAIEKYLMFRMLRSRSLAQVFCVDEYLQQYVEKQGNALATKITHLAEPVVDTSCADTRCSARRALGIRPDQLAILVYGSLGRRKGIPVLAKALANERGLKNVSLVLAGKHSNHLTQFLEGPDIRRLKVEGRLISLDRYFTEDDQSRVFTAADIVWLGYSGHYGSSGVQALAGRAGLPILATHKGLIGRLTKDHCLGEAVDTDDVSAVRSALLRLAADTGLRERYGANGEKTFASHSVDRFGQRICEKILGAGRSFAT